MTLDAIIIGSVVAYIACGSVVAGYVHARTRDEEAAVPAGIFWPILVVVAIGIKLALVGGKPLLRLGQRLALPRSQLPEARVVERKETP